MKALRLICFVMALAVMLSSCYTLEHTVGNGAKTGMTIEKKQWYALWGLIPINEVDSKAMASGANDYNIKSQVTFIDYVISAFTGIVSVVVQTVEVKK
ncbi:MAG: hypothetical protein Q7J34_06290 [Bacteroidales bacterium]|nr:hypothetical protein [Bacteroidales bacterium]